MSIPVERPLQGSRESPLPRAYLPISSDDLILLLQMDGAEVIGSDEHGGFVRAGRRLIFIQRAPAVDARDLRDALRAAGMGPGRFDSLLQRLQQEPAAR
jgi:hypothetical protein